MDDLSKVFELSCRIADLEEQVEKLKHHHLQFVTMLTYAMGGELTVTVSDYHNVPVGATLAVKQDKVTGDTVFKVSVPDVEEPSRDA